MPRIPRKIILQPEMLIHKVWRGHNREWIFKNDDEKSNYLKFLSKTISSESCDFQAVCLMSNHTHEIYKIAEVDAFCSFVRKHHTQFGMFYNRKNQRTGPVSESRPKIIPIKTEIQEMICNFYVHSNPIRAGMIYSVSDLKGYPHSTYPFYAHGIYKEWMKIVELPNWYLKLGTTPEEQRRYYVYLLNEYLQIPEETFIQTIQL